MAAPLRDAEPAALMLVGHRDRRNPLVDALTTFASGTVDGASDRLVSG